MKAIVDGWRAANGIRRSGRGVRRPRSCAASADVVVVDWSSTRAAAAGRERHRKQASRIVCSAPPRPTILRYALDKGARASLGRASRSIPNVESQRAARPRRLQLRPIFPPLGYLHPPPSTLLPLPLLLPRSRSLSGQFCDAHHHRLAEARNTRLSHPAQIADSTSLSLAPLSLVLSPRLVQAGISRFLSRARRRRRRPRPRPRRPRRGRLPSVRQLYPILPDSHC